MDYLIEKYLSDNTDVNEGWIKNQKMAFKTIAQNYVNIAKKIIDAVKKEELDILMMDIDMEIKENKVKWDKLWNQMR